jgi:NTP pyrophosphatase (non-canonical NTP hydrolase)
MQGLNEYQTAANGTDITAKAIVNYLEPILTALSRLQSIVSNDPYGGKESDEVELAISRVGDLSHKMLLWYNVLGMLAEAGEIANKIKKIIRDGKYDPKDLAKETGDVQWYIARFASVMGFDLETIATENIEKLVTRKAKGTLHGEGDNR